MISAIHSVAPEDLMALLDGELSAEEAKSVTAHLENCAECSQLADQFRSVSQSLAAWTIPAAPASLEETVLRDAANPTPSASSHGGKRPTFWNSNSWAVRVGGALAAIVILSLGLTFFRAIMMRPNRMNAYYNPNGDSAPATQPPAVQRFESDMPMPQAMNSLAYIAPGAVAAKKPEPRTKAMQQALTSTAATAPADTSAGVLAAPMIARTVSLSIIVKDISAARSALDSILLHYQGYSAQLTVNTELNSQRTVQASLRIPAPQLASALANLKSLGRVETETQSGEEVTQQHADLVARLQNSRETEQRLRDILSQRTGKIDDVLRVEEEIARVRGEIESMEAEQRALEHRVDFATIDLRLREELKEQFGTPSPSAATQIQNSFVSGIRSALATLLGLLLFLEETAPVLLVWLAILAVPAFFLWRRYRRIHAQP